MQVFSADVSSVRDIHVAYNVTTAPSLLEFEKGEFKNIIKGCNNVANYKSYFEDAVFIAATNKDEKPQKRVTVYSTPTCSWCNTLKSHLRMHKIRFTDINVAADQQAAALVGEPECREHQDPADDDRRNLESLPHVL